MENKDMIKGIKFNYNAIIESIDAYTGEVIKTTKVHNLVVNTGLDKALHLIGGIGSGAFEYMAIGTGTANVAATDTALGTEVQRQSVTPTDEGVGIILYDYTFSFTSGESYSITEAGLFDSATESGSTMLNRFKFGAHTVDVNNTLRVKITLTLANA